MSTYKLTQPAGSDSKYKIMVVVVAVVVVFVAQRAVI